MTHLGDSPVAERSWHTVHTNVGPTLLGVWYRAPDAPQEHSDTFETELAEYCKDHVYTVLVGDLNVYHQKWLRHSPGNTPLGQQLQDVCSNFNLKQVVKEPTHGSYLLDLVLTDAPALTKTTLLPKVADHASVLTTLRWGVTREQPVQRTV